jgi:hypothetical protein
MFECIVFFGKFVSDGFIAVCARFEAHLSSNNLIILFLMVFSRRFSDRFLRGGGEEPHLVLVARERMI